MTMGVLSPPPEFCYPLRPLQLCTVRWWQKFVVLAEMAKLAVLVYFETRLKVNSVQDREPIHSNLQLKLLTYSNL